MNRYRLNLYILGPILFLTACSNSVGPSSLGPGDLRITVEHPPDPLSVSMDGEAVIDMPKLETVRVKAEASGGLEGYSYRWYLDGERIDGATESSIEVGPGSALGLGQHRLSVIVADGTATASAGIVINVGPDLP